MAYTNAGLTETRMAESAAVKTGSNHGTFQPMYQPVATLNIGSGLAVGKVLYKDGLNVTLEPSQDLVVASSGNADGALSYSVIYETAPEVPANNTDMTETA